MHSRHRNILVWGITAIVALYAVDSLFPYLVMGGIAWLVLSRMTRAREP